MATQPPSRAQKVERYTSYETRDGALNATRSTHRTNASIDGRRRGSGIAAVLETSG